MSERVSCLDDLRSHLFDHIAIGISIIDALSGDILYVNDEFARILGVAKDEFVSGRLPFLEMTHPDDREENARLHASLMSGEIAFYAFDKRYITKSGGEIWAHVTSKAVRDQNGVVRWCAATIEEIAERKTVENQLGAAADVAAIATWNWSVSSDRTYASGQYHQVHGLPPHQSPPGLEQYLQMVHPEDRASLEAAVRSAISTGESYSHEYRTIRQNGETRWLRSTATCMFNAAGQVTNIVGATLDITEVKVRGRVKPPNRSIQKVLNYIHEHWNEPLSTDEIARSCSVSPRTIHNHFSVTGMSLMQYVKSFRLQKARAMLANPSLTTTVTEVALHCGFANHGHFSRDYRLVFGEKPSETLRR